MDRTMVARELVRIAESLRTASGGIYSDVVDVDPEEMAMEFAKYVLRNGGLRNVPRAKVQHSRNRVLVSGKIAKEPHSVAHPDKEGESIGIEVLFSSSQGVGLADIKVWLGGRLVERGATVSRKTETLERWLINVSSYVGQLIDIHKG